MSHETEWKDYLHFLKKNSKLIIFTTLITTLLVIGIVLLYNSRDTTQSTVEEVEESYQEEILEGILNEEIIYDELTTIDQAELKEYLNSEAAYFRIVVEKEDYSIFRDNVLLAQLFLQEEVIGNLEDDITTPITVLPELFITVLTNDDSSSLLLSFGTGSISDNEVMADYFYQLLSENSFEYLENKTVFFIDPEPIVRQEEDENDDLSIEVEDTQQASRIEVLIIVSMIGLLIGLLLAISVAFLKEMKSKQLTSLYNIKKHENIDSYIRLDSINVLDRKTLQYILIHSIFTSNKSKVILSEYDLPSDFIEKYQEQKVLNNSETSLLKNFEEISTNQRVDEVIILVDVDVNSKQWFNKEIEQLKGLDARVKVIRMPDQSLYSN